MGKTYGEKLLDPRWQRRRLEILGAANFACRDCGNTTKTLHVHHVLYIAGREPWEYPDHLLRSVCVDCHALHTMFNGSVDEILSGLRAACREYGLRCVSLQEKTAALGAIAQLSRAVAVWGPLESAGFVYLRTAIELSDSRTQEVG